MITINGAEFDIDLMDADVMERFENAAEEIQSKVSQLQAPGAKVSDVVRSFCNLTEDFLDEVLGDGASEDIFGGTQNMKEHMQAYEDLFKAVDVAKNEMDSFNKQFTSKYSPNRAQRRRS